MTWFSVIRSILRFIWYDEHNRICASVSRFPLSITLTRTWRVGYFVFIVLVLVVRVVVAPGLAAILLAVLYSSIWAPQIVRAARRGRPCALGMKYIVGTTAGRMLLALCAASLFNLTKSETDASAPRLVDVLGCPKNVMDVEPRRMSRADMLLMSMCADILLVAWVYLLLLIACTQVAVLGLQASLGPAFFLPQRVRYPIQPDFRLAHLLMALVARGFTRV